MSLTDIFFIPAKSNRGFTEPNVGDGDYVNAPGDGGVIGGGPGAPTLDTPAPTAPTAPAQKGAFLDRSSLTFSGVAVPAGIILNFVQRIPGANATLNYVLAAIIAVLLGAALTTISVLREKKTDAVVADRIEQGLLGIMNTLLLFGGMVGLASIGT